MFMYLFLLIFFVVYWVAPIPIQIILLCIDSFLPDPIPLIDEMLMIIVLGNRLRKVVAIESFIREHKILSVILLIAAVFLLGQIIIWIVSIL